MRVTHEVPIFVYVLTWVFVLKNCAKTVRYWCFVVTELVVVIIIVTTVVVVTTATTATFITVITHITYYYTFITMRDAAVVALMSVSASQKGSVPS